MLTSKSPSNLAVMQSFLSLTGPLHTHPKIARQPVINGEMSLKEWKKTRGRRRTVRIVGQMLNLNRARVLGVTKNTS